MCGNETGQLRGGCVRTVDDEGEEEHGEGQVLGVKVDDEELYGTRGIVLAKGVCVGEGQRWEEGVSVQKTACCCLQMDC